MHCEKYDAPTSARRRYLVQTVTIQIGSATAALEAFRTAFRALAAGRHGARHDRVSVVSMQAAWTFLARKRLALLRAVRNQHPDSIEELAHFLGRDLKDVQRDIRTLERHGLIRMSLGGRIGKRRARLAAVPFDEIILKIAL